MWNGYLHTSSLGLKPEAESPVYGTEIDTKGRARAFGVHSVRSDANEAVIEKVTEHLPLFTPVQPNSNSYSSKKQKIYTCEEHSLTFQSHGLEKLENKTR